MEDYDSSFKQYDNEQCLKLLPGGSKVTIVWVPGHWLRTGEYTKG